MQQVTGQQGANEQLPEEQAIQRQPEPIGFEAVAQQLGGGGIG